MMKNIIKVYSILLLTFLIGCSKKVDVAPGERPEERMKAALEELKSNILKSANGWKAELATAENNGFSFYFNFNDQDRVVSIADINNESSSVPFESGYRLRAVMGPSLLFDTYSYIHLLSDPNPNVSGGTVARGYSSDFEFEYNGISADSIVLVGKKRRTYLRLIPATAEEKDSYLKGEFKNKIADFSKFLSDNQNIYFQLPGSDTKYAISFNNKTKKSKIIWLEGNEVKSVEGPYAYTLTGVKFVKTLKLGDLYLSHLDLVSAVSAQIKDSNGNTYEVINNENPILPMSNLFAFNSTYKELYIGSNLPAGVISKFNTAYQSSVDKFKALQSRTLVSVKFALVNANTANVTTLNYRPDTDQTFIAVATYSYTLIDGTLTLSNPTYDGNWTARVTQLIDIQNWFLSGPFNIKYVKSTDSEVKNLGGLYRSDDDSDFFYGDLR